jgi:hypothetical protein
MYETNLQLLAMQKLPVLVSAYWSHETVHYQKLRSWVGSTMLSWSPETSDDPDSISSLIGLFHLHCVALRAAFDCFKTEW